MVGNIGEKENQHQEGVIAACVTAACSRRAAQTVQPSGCNSGLLWPSKRHERGPTCGSGADTVGGG